MEAQLIPLQTLYLNMLALAFKDEKLDTLILDVADGAHRLYAVRSGTTVPDVVAEVVFAKESMGIKLTTRNERECASVVTYAEGLDGYLQELRKLLRADRLEHKKAA